jgi:hypothetical protein
VVSEVHVGATHLLFELMYPTLVQSVKLVIVVHFDSSSLMQVADQKQILVSPIINPEQTF